MTKYTWETSSLNPPHWWQMRLGDGLITISIRYGTIANEFGYHVDIGSGLSIRRNVLPTLPQAKSWGIQTARSALKEMYQELKPEIPWLLLICLMGAIALHVVWIFILGAN